MGRLIRLQVRSYDRYAQMHQLRIEKHVRASATSNAPSYRLELIPLQKTRTR